MDRFRLDDPDAAEKALAIYRSGRVTEPYYQRPGMQRVLNAIEQPRPARLPTRSEVFDRADKAGWSIPQAVADFIVDNKWATEDPEPEVDPHITALGSLLLTTQDDDDVYGQARRLLASGRVQVTP